MYLLINHFRVFNQFQVVSRFYNKLLGATKNLLCSVGLGVGLGLFLTACGGGGGSPSGPITVPSSSSSSSVSVSSSSESSSSAVSSSSSSISSAPSLPTHASSGVIYCTPAGTDPDGDGWGWESNATCLVRNSAPDPDKGNFHGCVIGVGSWNYCSLDNGSWGSENNEICISSSFCPANRSATQTAMATDLTNPAASATAQAVYDYLREEVWGKKTLSGQQDLTWLDSTDMYQRVIDDTGKAPAIMGYDFMNYGMTGVSGLAQTEEAIEHWNRGGLVTFAWHWRDPSGTTNAFYSGATDYDETTSFLIPITHGELDTSHASYPNLQNDIDLIAGELRKLQDAGVVVLWRPLHEASGGWFWWGAPRADGVSPAYAQVVLWRHLYDRLVNHHGLQNLIWVWNGQNAGWYPGDAYVDIVSQDIYDGTRNYESQIDMFNTVKNFPLQEKMVALSENSNIPDPDAMAADNARWLWFVVWNDGSGAAGVSNTNNFWTGEHYNTNAHKQHVYNHPDVINLEDLPVF